MPAGPIPPTPVPTVYRIGVADVTTPDGDTDKLVVVSLSTPLGEHAYFFDPDAALILANTIRQEARNAKGADLTVAKAPLLGPDGKAIK